MKKSSFVFFIVFIVITGFFILDEKFDKSFISGLFSKDIKLVNEKSLSFMEDIKFKDFINAATYHSSEDQKKVNIPHLIERVFQIKPEFLDIIDYRVLDTSLDSEKRRARVKIKTKIHVLNSDEFRNPEIIFYFHKKDKWYMELESSLK